MKREIRDRWTAALRSGEYEQGRGTLRDQGDRYCCLGVLCDVLGQDVPRANRHTNLGPSDLYALVHEFIGREMSDYLTARNDGGDSFAAIAGYIDERIEIEP